MFGTRPFHFSKSLLGFFIFLNGLIINYANPPKATLVPRQLDLPTCYQLALKRSERLAITGEEIRYAKARFRESVAAILPKINFFASARFQNNPSGRSSSSGISDEGGVDSVNNENRSGGRRERYETGIRLTQPIFAGFREFYASAAAKANIEARGFDYARAKQILFLDVADAFYQVLLYERDLKLLAFHQNILEDLVKELGRRLDIGRSRKGEVLEAQTELATLRVTIEQSRGVLKSAKELLGFLIGMPAEQIQVIERQALPQQKELANYLAATGERPDLLSALASEEAATKTLSAARAERWPQIALEANYFPYDEPAQEREWNVFITFDFPIFDGGAIEARVEQQKARLRQAILTVEQLRRTAAYEVRTAYHDLNTSVAQTLQLRNAEEVATKNFDVQQKDYGLGVVSNLDVLDARQSLQEIRRQLLGTEIEGRINLIRLNIAAGRF